MVCNCEVGVTKIQESPTRSRFVGLVGGCPVKRLNKNCDYVQVLNSIRNIEFPLAHPYLDCYFHFKAANLPFRAKLLEKQNFILTVRVLIIPALTLI